MERRTSRWGWMAGMVFLMGTVWAQPVREATVIKVKGEVTVKSAAGEWQPAKAGVVLRQEDQIRTGKGGFAEILLDDGKVGRLELKENSHLRLNTLSESPSSGDRVTLLDLAVGKVLVHAQKLRGESKFEVRTPTSTTGVRGTVFEVSVEEKP